VSKLAVRGLTIAFAKEFGPSGIRVNAISPGLMATPSALADLPPAMLENFVKEFQFIRRSGEMQDVTSAALFLASEAASFITGETLKVSGGYPVWI
jgi:NAD(P)-dependent dehydrogenase (short-subunit alcohol dehydrogenase family)